MLLKTGLKVEETEVGYSFLLWDFSGVEFARQSQTTFACGILRLPSEEDTKEIVGKKSKSKLVVPSQFWSEKEVVACKQCYSVQKTEETLDEYMKLLTLLRHMGTVQ